MPPSNRRTRARKEPEAVQQSDGDGPDVIRTPSRKRRRVNNDPATRSSGKGAPTTTTRRRSGSAATDATLENDGQNDSSILESSQAQIDETIRRLKVSAKAINAAIDYNNEFVDMNKQAYAKIAGRDWTYFADKINIVIGRVVKKTFQKRVQAEAGGDGLPAADTDANGSHAGSDSTFEIHIDLGPEHQVSRVHAEIFYTTDGKWSFMINGRNGAKVDETYMEAGKSCFLRSGSVISINGTEMLFCLPNEPVIIAPVILERNTAEEASDDGDEDEGQGEWSEGDVNPKEEEGAAPSSRRGAGAGESGASSRNAKETKHSASSNRQMPGTPAASIKKSPLLGKGLVLEGAQDIDYSLDVSKDIKPPFSYAYMIGAAIIESDEQALTLAQLYDNIKEKYAYYRLHNGGSGWQNSIRHNLSLNKAFEKIPRRTDEPGKGMKWRIVPNEREDFVAKTIQNARRGNHRHGSSGPNSPAFGNPSPIQASQRLQTALDQANASHKPSDVTIKTSPRSPSPRLTSYPTANVSFTPDRGPRPSIKKSPGLKSLTTSNLPKPKSENKTPTFYTGAPELTMDSAQSSASRSDSKEGLLTASQHSPPTLSSSMMDHGHQLVTPIIARQAPRFGPPPSTVHVPSQYMTNLSSPAPFWKYMEMGTPAKIPSDFSPLKALTAHSGDETKLEPKEEDDDDGAPAVQPSSPPQLMDAKEEEMDVDMSPSRSNPRPNSRRDGPVPKMEPLGKPMLGASLGLGLHSVGGLADVKGLNGGNTMSVGPALNDARPNGINSVPQRPSFNGLPMAAAEDEEEGGIDLAKGFQKIGTYHRSFENRRVL